MAYFDLRLCNNPKGFILTLLRIFQFSILFGNYGIRMSIAVYSLGITLTLINREENICLEVPGLKKM